LQDSCCPLAVEDRAVPGHWEGDLLISSKSSQIATLVERHTRYVMLAKVKSKDTRTVINALIKHAHKLPPELYKSLTWDHGKEMADHQRFSLDTNIEFISVTHEVLGNAVRMRIPMACSDSTSRKEPICQYTHKLNSVQWPDN